MEYNTGNLSRKIVNVHLNLPGHFFYSMPVECLELFYCFEIGKQGNPHTHIGAVLSEPLTKREIIQWFTENNENVEDEMVNQPWTDADGNVKTGLQPYQVKVASHSNWGTVWGYHYGFGDKPACENPPVWPNKTDEEVRYMVQCRIHHSKVKNCHQQVEKTSDLLSRSPFQNLMLGNVSLRGYRGFSGDWEAATRDKKRFEWLEEGKQIEEEEQPKCRHFWIWGVSNTGKTYKAKHLYGGDYYMAPRNNDWGDYAGQKVVIFDEFQKDRVSPPVLQEICNGSMQQNVKGSSTRLRPDVTIVICCHASLKALYYDTPYLEIQGLLNRFNEYHLTYVYPRISIEDQECMILEDK